MIASRTGRAPADHRRVAAVVTRGVGTVAALTIAAVHLSIAGSHIREVPVVGALFVTLAVVCIGGALLLWQDPDFAWPLLGGAGLAAIAAYVLSRSVGFPGMADDLGRWADPLGIVALSLEAVLVIGAAAAVLSALTGNRRAEPQTAEEPHRVDRP